MDDNKLRLFNWSFDYRSATFWVIIIGGMANNLISYTSDQTVIQRYLTTKDEAGARRSILLNGVMSVFVSIAFFAIGAGLYTFFKTHPAELDFTMAKADTIFPLLHDESIAPRHCRATHCSYLCSNDEHDIFQHQLGGHGL